MTIVATVVFVCAVAVARPDCDASTARVTLRVPGHVHPHHAQAFLAESGVEVDPTVEYVKIRMRVGGGARA